MEAELNFKQNIEEIKDILMLMGEPYLHDEKEVIYKFKAS